MAKTTRTISKTQKKAPAPKAKAPAAKPTRSASSKPAADKKVKKKEPVKKEPKQTKVARKPAAPAPKAPAPRKAAEAPAKPAPAPKPAPPEKLPTPVPAAAAAPTPEAGDKKKLPAKSMTVVTPKPAKTSKPKPKFQLPSQPLLKPGAKWKPLIPSGPSAPPRTEFGVGGPLDGSELKTKFNKKELDRYRQILLQKRDELIGDIRNMEDEALRQSSGSLSHTPQHMAEQGTDVFDQSLNLDLAAVDRNLIREIDAALERIDAGTYGICELTGKPISNERLEELPWARYSIEAARERERRSYLP